MEPPPFPEQFQWVNFLDVLYKYALHIKLYQLLFMRIKVHWVCPRLYLSHSAVSSNRFLDDLVLLYVIDLDMEIQTDIPNPFLNKAENAKDLLGAEESPALSVGSPVISEPISVNTDRVVTKAQLENGAQSDVPCGGDDSFPERKDPERVTTVLKGSNYPEGSREEQAATKAQSAFRGYLVKSYEIHIENYVINASIIDFYLAS